MDERENREAAASTRSQSVVHYIERNIDDAARLVSALLERSGGADGDTGVLAVLPSSDEALALCEAVQAAQHSDRRSLSPITSLARGRRLLSAGARAIAGAPAELAPLIAESRLTFVPTHTVVLVWPEEILATEQGTLLESLLGEVPKTSERVALCAAKSAELTQFLERSMWRARTVDHAPPANTWSTTPIRVLTAVPRDRLRALRSVLDALDPPTTVLLTFTDEGEHAARNATTILGSGDELVQVSRGIPDRRFALGVVFDDVPTAEQLQGAALVAGELVAIVRPARLPAFQKVASGSIPFAWTGALAHARSAHDMLRDEIRFIAGAGSHLPWVPLVEPLLEGLDAVDVAAAALSLLDRERRRLRKAVVAAATPTAPVEREARPDSFRRPAADRDDRRGERSERSFTKPREGGGWKGPPRKRDDDTRRGPPRDRGDRPTRDPRSRGRDDRPGANARGRGGRPGEIERVPRAAHEGREWSERGERLKNARRGPRGGAAESK